MCCCSGLTCRCCPCAAGRICKQQRSWPLLTGWRFIFSTETGSRPGFAVNARSLTERQSVACFAGDRVLVLDDLTFAEMETGQSAYPSDLSNVLDNLRMAGVQQAHKEDRITFTALTGWPGEYICAEGRYMGSEKQRRAGIFIGPEFGTVARPDLVAAAREAADAGFDVLIACAFNFDAHSAEFDKLGRIPVLKARMNTDLHMADQLKNTGAGNLFVIFGEPDIEIMKAGEGQIQVRVRGVDIFRPQEGKVESDSTDTIALWMIDTDYNEESFFVRHAYFLGANDPYKALKTTLRAEIDPEAWSSTTAILPAPSRARNPAASQ